MPDRVKGSVFDILAARLGTPGAVPGLGVADFFAGSGSLGLEAVSRGAAACVFIERDRTALRVLRRNLEALGAGPNLRVVAGDVWRRSLTGLLDRDRPVGLVFLDPPYADSRDYSPGGKTSRLLRRLVRGRWLTEDAVVVLHHERVVRLAPKPADRWEVVDRREYGDTAVSFLAPAGGSDDIGKADAADPTPAELL